jgi:hypothetical protein
MLGEVRRMVALQPRHIALFLDFYTPVTVKVVLKPDVPHSLDFALPRVTVVPVKPAVMILHNGAPRNGFYILIKFHKFLLFLLNIEKPTYLVSRFLF